MIQVTITAFGYEHTFEDSYTIEDLDIIENAPVLYLLSGDDDKIEAFVSLLDSDWMALWTEAGECICFGYEYFTADQDFLIEVIDLAYEREDRSEIAA